MGLFKPKFHRNRPQSAVLDASAWSPVTVNGCLSAIYDPSKITAELAADELRRYVAKYRGYESPAARWVRLERERMGGYSRRSVWYMNFQARFEEGRDLVLQVGDGVNQIYQASGSRPTDLAVGQAIWEALLRGIPPPSPDAVPPKLMPGAIFHLMGMTVSRDLSLGDWQVRFEWTEPGMAA